MMDETVLLSALRQDIDASSGQSYEKLNYDRARALKYYLGEPYGNETEGRSRFITTEVQDTIEGMLPSIMKVFVASERAVFFDPIGPEDEEAAKQETDYVNHVFYKENEGFQILYTWFKDGLLSKNGIVKYFWEEKEKITTESYTSLTEQEYTALIGQDDVEVVEQTETMEMVVTPAGGVQVAFYDVKIKRTENRGQVRIMNIPPEEFLIDTEYNSLCLQDVPFCAHETYTTLSDLKAQGYDTKDLEHYAGYSARADYDDIEQEQRFIDISDDPFDTDDENNADPSMRRVKLTEAYKRVDFDEDGYAELRRILLVNETHILENEEMDYVPFEVITPIPMTHRFFGRSVADQTLDVQLQKTMLTRNIFDNLYLMNNVRYEAVEGEVNLADALDSKPGGVVRVSRPGMLTPIPVQPFTGHAFGMLEYLDSVKENRTGVTRYNQGTDADSLNKTATGVQRIMDASAQRLEMVARLYGEGVRRLMLGIHRLLQQNQDKQKIVKLRGQWVPVNPNQWRERTDMSVVVGLGTENKDKLLGHLAMILDYQRQAMEAGLPIVNEMNLYNTLVKLVENAGLKHPDMYFTDPQTIEPPPPEPDPQVEMVQAQLQVAQQDVQVKAQKGQQDYDIDLRKLVLEERKMDLEERKQALVEMQAVGAADDDARSAEIEASQAEIDARQAEMQAGGQLNG